MKKQLEREKIETFLKKIGCQNIEFCDSKENENPDAIATCELNGKKIKLGIEETEYRVDAMPGKESPGSALERLWNEIASEIGNSNLEHISGLVWFKKEELS